MDTLSFLLSLANVTAHSNVLVFDMLEGIVTGSVAERMGGLLFRNSIIQSHLFVQTFERLPLHIE